MATKNSQSSGRSSSTRRTSSGSKSRSTATRRQTTSASRSASATTRRTRATATQTRSSGASRTSGSSASSKRTKRGSKGYATVKQQLDQTIQSLQQLKKQTEGKAPKGRPSAATLTRFANVVQKGGAICQTTTRTVQQAARWNKPCTSAASIGKALKSKYGAAIKAVTPAKNGGWLIATSATWKGRPFKISR